MASEESPTKLGIPRWKKASQFIVDCEIMVSLEQILAFTHISGTPPNLAWFFPKAKSGVTPCLFFDSPRRSSFFHLVHTKCVGSCQRSGCREQTRLQPMYPSQIEPVSSSKGSMEIMSQDTVLISSSVSGGNDLANHGMESNFGKYSSMGTRSYLRLSKFRLFL
jgi:hypothetical protein